MKIIDLHMHSTLSDGELSVSSLIEESKKQNCKLISITDHETINDFSKLSDEKLEIVNGIEFNSSEKNLHLLGYGIKNINNISKIMEDLAKENELICIELVNLLQKKGYDISIDQIKEYFIKEGINYKYLDKKKITKYLIYKNYASDVHNVYLNIIGRNTENYIPIKKSTPEYIINLILENGGIPALAHPSSLNTTNDELLFKLKKLKELGLEALETYNPIFTNYQAKSYQNFAKKLNLLETAGSDFHTYKKQTIGLEVPDEIYNNFKVKVRKLK